MNKTGGSYRRFQRVDKVATLSEKCKIAFLGIQDFLCRFATRPEILQGSGDKGWLAVGKPSRSATDFDDLKIGKITGLRSSAAYMPPPAD